MTPKERQVLDFISQYWKDHRYGPTYDEIATDIGLASKSGISRITKSLIAQGHLISTPKRARSLRLPDANSTPLRIAATLVLSSITNENLETNSATVSASAICLLELAMNQFNNPLPKEAA